MEPPVEVVLRVVNVGTVAGTDPALFWEVLPLACDALRWILPNSSVATFDAGSCGTVLNAFDAICGAPYPLSS